MSKHLQFLPTFLYLRQLHFLYILFFHQDMQRLCILILLQEFFEFFIRLLPFLICSFQILQLFLDLLTMLLSFFILQTLPKLLFKRSFFSLFHFLISLYLLHFFLKQSEILINLFNLDSSSIRSGITLRKYVIDVPDIKLHFQPIILFLLHFCYFTAHDFLHQFIHLLVSDLLDSIFQDLAIDLTIINIPQELSIVLGKVPKGSLLDCSRHLPNLLFINVRIGILLKESDKQVALRRFALTHHMSINKLLTPYNKILLQRKIGSVSRRKFGQTDPVLFIYS